MFLVSLVVLELEELERLSKRHMPEKNPQWDFVAVLPAVVKVRPSSPEAKL